MSSPTGFGQRGVQANQGGPQPTNPPPTPKGGRDPIAGNIGHLLFSFDGRLPRLQYWLGQIGSFAIFQVIISVNRYSSSALKSSEVAGGTSLSQVVVALVVAIAMLLLILLVFWVSLVLVVKRWHDRGKSWVWALLGFVPIIGWAWQGIECGFLEGTLGPNRYGPSPKGISGVTYGEVEPATFA